MSFAQHLNTQTEHIGMDQEMASIHEILPSQNSTCMKCNPEFHMHEMQSTSAHFRIREMQSKIPHA